MWIRILRHTTMSGLYVSPGETYDATAQDAAILLSLNKAEQIEDPNLPNPVQPSRKPRTRKG